MRKRTQIQDWLASVLFPVAIAIAVFYSLYAIGYIRGSNIVTDAAIYTVLVTAIIAGNLFYLFYAIHAGPPEKERTMSFLQNGIRYFLAFIFLNYAVIKICGNMFSTSLATLDTPLYKLSGFSLTWRFFGYSPVYNWMVILMQLFCGVLLLFRRTTLAACLLGFGMMANITAINFTHHIQLKLFSVIYTVMLAYFILLHSGSLIRSVFHTTQPDKEVQPSYLITYYPYANRLLLFFFLVPFLICAVKEWKVKSHFAETSDVTGVWNLVSPGKGLFKSTIRIIFDRGGEGTLKDADGKETPFSYKVNSVKGELQMVGLHTEKDTTRLFYKIISGNSLALFANADTIKLKKLF